MRITNEMLFAVAVFGAVLVIALLIRSYFVRLRNAEQLRLQSNIDDSGEFRSTELPREKGFFDRLDASFEQAVGRTGMEISPAGTLAFIAFCGVILAGIVHFWKDNFLLTMAAAALGMAIPLGVIMILQARYRRALQEQLPDALYTLARSLRAGLGIEQAIEVYAQQGNKPLSEEFSRIVGQLRIGTPISGALDFVSKRIQLLDFNIFVSTVALYRQTGGNLSLLLDRLAASVRDRNLFRGRFAAATAQGRVVAIMLAAFGPCLLLGYAIWEPDHIQAFFQSTTGWLILLGCLLLETIGAIWMWQILKLDY